MQKKQITQYAKKTKEMLKKEMLCLLKQLNAMLIKAINKKNKGVDHERHERNKRNQ